jgi:transposase
MPHRPYRRYSLAFRASAVDLIEAGGTVTGVAAELGIPVRTLARWRAETRATSAPPPRTPDAPSYAELAAEVQRLRAELADVREENELLGKASAYFARHARPTRS